MKNNFPDSSYDIKIKNVKNINIKMKTDEKSN